MKITTSGSVCPTAPPPRSINFFPLISRLLCASPARACMQPHAPQTSVHVIEVPPVEPRAVRWTGDSNDLDPRYERPTGSLSLRWGIFQMLTT